MDAKRLTGPLAGVLKYDLLTALTVTGLNGSPGLQTTIMRLTVLLTARYNWRYDELTVGQRDMARIWGVNERTVKREVKRLTEAGILICKRKGVRGRVGAYRLNLQEVYRLSMPHWAQVGPDFAERMSQQFSPDKSSVVRVNFGTTRPDEETAQPHDGTTSGSWRHVMQRLRQSHPDLSENWYSKLEMQAFEEGCLTLLAPSQFVARYIKTQLSGQLVYAASEVLGPVERLNFAIRQG